MTKASVIRLEKAVFDRDFEASCTELLAILGELDSSFGSFAEIECNYPNQLNFSEEERAKHFCQRVANATTELFHAKNDFGVSESGFARFMTYHRWLGIIFATSAFVNADHIIATYHKGKEGEELTALELANDLNVWRKFCILYTQVVSMTCDKHLLATTGCMGTKSVSSGISSAGSVQQENVVFPVLEKAWQKDGIFPNTENLSKVRAGVAKDELYQLIGRPHFSESNRAREWDYIMKFYQADDSVKICQYKVIFDDKFKGQEFYWKPADCEALAKPVPQQPVIVQQPAPVQPPVVIAPPVAPIISEKINLSADALFYFDKWKPEDMLPKGRPELDALAEKLRDYQTRGRLQVLITGHTDYLGEDMYNMNLSQLRAQTVRAYLVQRGVDSSSLMTSGAGESQPIKSCNANQPRKALIDCLQPNRRVEVEVSVYAIDYRQGEPTVTFN